MKPYGLIYDTFNEDQRRNAVEIIAKSSIKLNSLINNILDFSKLSSLNDELNKKDINLSELLHERIKICKKLYLNGKILNFVSDIEKNIIIFFSILTVILIILNTHSII